MEQSRQRGGNSNGYRAEIEPAMVRQSPGRGGCILMYWDAVYQVRDLVLCSRDGTLNTRAI